MAARPGLYQANHSLFRSSSTVVSGRVRPARFEVDRVFGTGAACRRAGVCGVPGLSFVKPRLA
jgi:hypothetical protein